MMADPELRITITVLPADGGLNLAHETRLVKAALLYADRVTLASPMTVILGGLASFSAYLASGPDAMLAMISQLTGRREVADKYLSLKRKKNRSVVEEKLLGVIEGQLLATSNEVAGVMGEAIEEADVAELEMALNAGVVDIDALGAADTDFDIEAIIGRAAEVIAESVAPAANTYAMFNDAAGDLLRAMIREGKVVGPDLGAATNVAVAGQYISMLDAFPDAPMEIVLDVRSQLRRPLVRFRAALAEMTGALEVTALDENFSRVAEDLYRKRVAPALLELEEISEQLRIRELLRHEVATSARPAAEAVLAFAATAAADLSAVAQVALSSVVPAADFAGSMYLRRAKLQDRRQRNSFFFLFEADRHLAAS